MSSVESTIVVAFTVRFLSLFYFEKLKKIEYLEIEWYHMKKLWGHMKLIGRPLSGNPKLKLGSRIKLLIST